VRSRRVLDGASHPKRFGYRQVRGGAVPPIALSGAAERDLDALETWPIDNEINNLIKVEN